MNCWHAIARIGLLLATPLLGLSLSQGLQAEENELLKQINVLDKRYQKVIADHHRAAPRTAETIDNLDILLSRVVATSEQQHPIPAISLLVSNLDRLEAEPDHPAIAKLTDFLLEHNEWQLVEQIHNTIEDLAGDTNQAYLNYNLAKYHARLHQWEKVFSLVQDVFSELSSDDSDYAYLLQGSAQQYLRQHRASIESYANIPENSKYYIHAQLNTAVANLRQGWITEARLNIQSVIPASLKFGNGKLTNRLYLVLGYALLNKEYYRDARDAFRKVSLDSQYANKALLGLALTAISQGDYVGGLNALNILKQKQSRDLAAEEAYILLPYIYERLDQPERIADSFQESIDHFQKRIIELNKIKTKKLEFAKIDTDSESGDIILDDIRFAFSQHYPLFVLRNRNNLDYLSNSKPASKYINQITELLGNYDETLQAVLIDVIDKRKQIYTSYLNQSRYGLARHFDNQPQGSE